MKATRFRCAKCGCKRLEEVMVNVSQSTAIEGLDEDGLLVYGNGSTEGGEIDRFQCLECGEVVRDEKRGLLQAGKNVLQIFLQGRAHQRIERA